MPYRVTQAGMLNGVQRTGGDMLSDEEFAALPDTQAMLMTGYLVPVDEAPPPKSAPEPEPKPAPAFVKKRSG